jgi:hypothetical protein
VAGEQLPLGFDAREVPRADRVAAAERLADALSQGLRERVRLVVHDNRSTMVSYRRAGGEIRIRVHHLFLGAPPDVARALGEFARARRPAARRQASLRIDAWVKVQRQRIAPPPQRALRARGRVHDLQAMLDRLNSDYFGGAIRARIGWGRSGARPGRRSIKTGVYLHHASAIRIHPALDREDVPAYYVEAVVFHEMLHEVVPPQERGGRRIVHGSEFRARERLFPGYARARSWERAHLHVLLAAPTRR